MARAFDHTLRQKHHLCTAGANHRQSCRLPGCWRGKRKKSPAHPDSLPSGNRRRRQARRLFLRAGAKNTAAESGKNPISALKSAIVSPLFFHFQGVDFLFFQRYNHPIKSNDRETYCRERTFSESSGCWNRGKVQRRNSSRELPPEVLLHGRARRNPTVIKGRGNDGCPLRLLREQIEVVPRICFYPSSACDLCRGRFFYSDHPPAFIDS